MAKGSNKSFKSAEVRGGDKGALPPKNHQS
jgi:hypothetical protein